MCASRGASRGSGMYGTFDNSSLVWLPAARRFYNNSGVKNPHAGVVPTNSLPVSTRPRILPKGWENFPGERGLPHLKTIICAPLGVLDNGRTNPPVTCFPPPEAPSSLAQAMRSKKNSRSEAETSSIFRPTGN